MHLFCSYCVSIFQKGTTNKENKVNYGGNNLQFSSLNYGGDDDDDDDDDDEDDDDGTL